MCLSLPEWGLSYLWPCWRGCLLQLCWCGRHIVFEYCAVGNIGMIEEWPVESLAV